MQALSPTIIAYLVAAPLIAWRMYARIKRVVGRQHFSVKRPWITLSIFPLIMVLLIVTAPVQVASLGAMAAGLVLGVALGFYGLRRTQFEVTPQGLYYTPNAHLGIALSLVFIGRIIYRAIQVEAMTQSGAGGFSSYHSTPLTLAVFGLLAGYYMTYAIGLLRWHAKVRDTAPGAT